MTLSNIASASQGAYGVVVSNLSGAHYQRRSELTVLPSNASPQVENIWNVLPEHGPI